MTKNFQLVDVVSALKAKANQVRRTVTPRGLATLGVMGAMGAMMVVPEAAMAGTGGASLRMCGKRWWTGRRERWAGSLPSVSSWSVRALALFASR
ncbi:Uncharacterised protein [Pseudomonas luteola]|uniref:Uncharacterized protein n=1 Tax=Pseudomonas luteola TaxID=47886 RepID=A0A2X2BV79_PSELU|nr:hypothetical protein [Pseudomonas luteola]SPZ00302.1 Uncharacterised protein [Pseudomonas luteola]